MHAFQVVKHFAADHRREASYAVLRDLLNSGAACWAFPSSFELLPILSACREFFSRIVSRDYVSVDHTFPFACSRVAFVLLFIHPARCRIKVLSLPGLLSSFLFGDFVRFFLNLCCGASLLCSF
jgi:hypothetical protein